MMFNKHSYIQEAMRAHLLRTRVSVEFLFARLRLIGLTLGSLVLVPLGLAGTLPLEISRTLFLGSIAGFLLYALIYLLMRPWERYSVRAAARFSTLMDLGIALFFILNTHGLTSPIWMSVPLLLLSYTMRFGYSVLDLFLWAAAFATMTVVSSAVVPTSPAIATVTLAATLIISGLTVALAQVMVDQEREAFLRAIEAEDRAVDTMIQTLQHDVNNPLAILSGNIELLEHNSHLPADAPYLIRIRHALRRISHALSRLEDLRHDPELRSKQDVWAYIAGRASLGLPDDYEDLTED